MSQRSGITILHPATWPFDWDVDPNTTELRYTPKERVGQLYQQRKLNQKRLERLDHMMIRAMMTGPVLTPMPATVVTTSPPSAPKYRPEGEAWDAFPKNS